MHEIIQIATCTTRNNYGDGKCDRGLSSPPLLRTPWRRTSAAARGAARQRAAQQCAAVYVGSTEPQMGKECCMGYKVINYKGIQLYQYYSYEYVYIIIYIIDVHIYIYIYICIHIL